MLRFAPEGFPFIAFFAVLTIGAYLFGGSLIAILPFVLTLFMFYFFRDPERDIPEGQGLYVSPADGKIIVIKEFFEGQYLKREALMISIFMSPLNVHVNRSPCGGVVREVRYTPGGKAAAYKEEASLRNENIAMVIEEKEGIALLVRQVAGSIARRAVNRKRQGDSLKRGERFGIIKFSSRVDLYLPKGVNVKVKLNDRVLAGETVIAEG